MTTPDYDTDFYTWTQRQAAAIRAKEWAALDLEHLAEEIESVGRSERYAIESQLERLLLHLLKWRDDPAQRPRRGWRLTIEHARREIAKRAMGALQAYPAQYLATAYRYARRDLDPADRPAASDGPRGLPVDNRPGPGGGLPPGGSHMLTTRHPVDYAYTPQELDALFRYANVHDVDKGGHDDARSAAINVRSHHWAHPATMEEFETIGTFYVHWEPPALWEIETDEGFSLEDLMAELGRLELEALGRVKRGHVP